MTAYTIQPARYAKGMMAISCPSDNGLKSRADRLIGDGLNCRYSGREGAYIASQSATARFIDLFADGWDASVITGRLEMPTNRSFNAFVRPRWGDRWAIARKTPNNLARYDRCVTRSEFAKAEAEFRAMCSTDNR